MIRVPGERPNVPPPIAPKEAKPPEETKPEAPKIPIARAPQGSIHEPELDSRAIAVRMAALATEAKEKELSFEEIIQKAIEETGMTNPQAALEEANRLMQEEIEEILEQIKTNKDLMEEAESWEEFGKILEHELSQDQVESFLGLLKEHIKGL